MTSTIPNNNKISVVDCFEIGVIGLESYFSVLRAEPRALCMCVWGGTLPLTTPQPLKHISIPSRHGVLLSLLGGWDFSRLVHRKDRGAPADPGQLYKMGDLSPKGIIFFASTPADVHLSTVSWSGSPSSCELNLIYCNTKPVFNFLWSPCGTKTLAGCLRENSFLDSRRHLVETVNLFASPEENVSLIILRSQADCSVTLRSQYPC